MYSSYLSLLDMINVEGNEEEDKPQHVSTPSNFPTHTMHTTYSVLVWLTNIFTTG